MLDQMALGAMVREARLRRGWRPIDLALEMGWSGTAPVYRLERPGADTSRPTSATVNLLAHVLELDYADRMTLLGFAGHLPDTEWLTPQEEARLIALARPIMEGAEEPMILYDYRERILAVNGSVLRPLGLDDDVVAGWREAGLTAFDLLWDARHGFRSHFRNIADIVRSQMLLFKLDNRLRRHEAWYRAYPACCAHYPGFLPLWAETEDILSQPVSERDFSSLIPRTNEILGPEGQVLRFDVSRRLLHAGYGLAALGVYRPLDDCTRRWLAASASS